MLDSLECERGKKVCFGLLNHVNRNGIERVGYDWNFACK